MNIGPAFNCLDFLQVALFFFPKSSLKPTHQHQGLGVPGIEEVGVAKGRVQTAAQDGYLGMTRREGQNKIQSE